MEGLHIFVHAVRQVFGNLGGALRVTGVLSLAQVLVSVGFLVSVGDFSDHYLPSPRVLVLTAAYVVVFIGLGIWMAVGWHRLILLNEVPRFVPVLHFDRMKDYLVKLIAATVVLMLIGLMIGFVAGLGMAVLNSLFGPIVASLLGGLFITLPLMMFGFRLMMVLPGVASQEGVSLKQGWKETEDKNKPLAFLALLFLLMGILLYLVLAVVPDGFGLLFIIASWIMFMVGASILTTLYGHYILNRPLV